MEEEDDIIAMMGDSNNYLYQVRKVVHFDASDVLKDKNLNPETLAYITAW